MTTLLAFVVTISILVVFHELGHFFVARRFGVKVLRFSLGFGHVIYSKRYAGSDTEWVISAIPLGGYVKMVDEREEEVAPEDLPYAFNRKPVLQRMAIVAAGPAANFLLAILLYWVLFIYGVPGLKPILGDVPPGSPAARAQMQHGDTLVSIDGEAVPSWHELRWMLINQVLQQSQDQPSGRLKVEVQNESGTRVTRILDISSLEAGDLDGEFLDKLGLRLFQPILLPVVGKVLEGSVAQLAGLQEGDVIARVNGMEMAYWNNVVEAIHAHPGETVRLEIQRGEAALSLSLVPQSVTESGKKIGLIGIGPKVDERAWQAMVAEVRYGPLDAASRALRKTWETSAVSLKMLGKMVVGEVSMRNLSGPITIADYAGQSAEMGVAAFIGFLALISISLGVLNLLPIPLLDGGHLLYYVAELVKGSPVSEKAWEVGQHIGIVLLGLLIIFAVFNDINRLVSG